MKSADLWEALRVGIEKILPAHCLHCEQRCYKPEWLCGVCEEAVERDDCMCQHSSVYRTTPSNCPLCGRSFIAPLMHVHTPLANTGVVQSLIQQWKFQNYPQLTALLVRLALSEQGVYRPSPQRRIVPMPMHGWKRYRRGYNQSELLARALARQWRQQGYNANLDTTALKSRFRITAQHTLNRKQRLAAPAMQFRVCTNVTNQHFLLVDDVITTGATLKAAATALLAAGAASVSGWCLARTP